MTFEEAESVDIPSHIMREQQTAQEAVFWNRYTLTYNEGTEGLF